MIPCPVCQTELLPYMVEDIEGKEFQWALRSGKGWEPAFYCPGAIRYDGHGANLWTETWIVCWVRMQKRLKKWRKEY